MKKQKKPKRKPYQLVLAILLPLSVVALVLFSMSVLGRGVHNKTRPETEAQEAAVETEKGEAGANSSGAGRTAGVFRQDLSGAEHRDTEPAEAAAAVFETEAETETETETEPVVYEDTVMLFTGDVLLWDGTLNAYVNGGLDGLLAPELRQPFQEADILMINEEFPFSNRGEPADKQFTFRCDPVYVRAFQEMGVDIVTLANNHTLDFGQDALLDSLETLEGAGIPYVGAGRNLEEAKRLVTFELNGRTFGFLGASRVWPDGAWSADYDRPGMFGTYDPTQLLEEIHKAKEVCDFVTVFVHWGIERNTTPEEYQRAMAKQYEEAGADLVIGSHPHVLQGFEFINDMPVFYSLGNFIFNTRTYDTAVVRAVVRGDGTTEFSLIPARSDGARVSLLTGDAGSQLFSYLNTISYGALADENGVLRKE